MDASNFSDFLREVTATYSKVDFYEMNFWRVGGEFFLKMLKQKGPEMDSERHVYQVFFKNQCINLLEDLKLTKMILSNSFLEELGEGNVCKWFSYVHKLMH